MRTLYAYLKGRESIELLERDILPLKEDEVLVEATQASICDADLRAYRGMYMPGDLPSFEYIGHEGGGVVVDVGAKVTRFLVGDRVMAFGPVNTLSSLFKSAEDFLQPVPDNLTMKQGCLGEPTAVGLFGLFESGAQLGDLVLVAGLNYQGHIVAQGFKKMSCEVIVVDYSGRHLELAKQRGADIVVNSHEINSVAHIRGITNGRGVDVAFHSCGYWNPHAEEYFNLCAELVRDEGIMVSIPDMMSPIKANLHRIHHHAVDLRFPALMHHGKDFINRAVPRLFRPIEKRLITIEDLVTAEFPLSQLEQAIRLFDTDEDQIKIIINPRTG